MKVSYDLNFEKFLDLWSKAEKVKTKRHSISLVHCILKVSIPMLRQKYSRSRRNIELHKLGNKLTADDKKYQQKSGMVYPCKRGNYHKAGR